MNSYPDSNLNSSIDSDTSLNGSPDSDLSVNTSSDSINQIRLIGCGNDEMKVRTKEIKNYLTSKTGKGMITKDILNVKKKFTS